jgi:hypothetical protein
MKNVTFSCSLENLKIDREGEAKLVLTIPAIDMEEVAKFYALNFGKLLGGALVVREEKENSEEAKNE